MLFLYTSILKDSFIQPLLYCIYDSPWSQHEDFHVLWNYFNIDETLCLTCIHVYMGVGTAGGGAFFCLIFFFWWVVQFFQFASNATVYDLLNDHVLWKKNQTTDPQIPNLNTTGSFVNKFSKKKMLLFCAFDFYKIVPWMISLCRTPWNISAD